MTYVHCSMISVCGPRCYRVAALVVLDELFLAVALFCS